MEEALSILKNLCIAIYQERDPQKTLSYFTEDVIVQGIADNRTLHNLEEARTYISEFLPLNPPMELAGLVDEEVKAYGADCCSASATVNVTYGSESASIQISLFLKGNKVSLLHMSIPFSAAVAMQHLENLEEKLRENEQAYRAVVNHAGIWYWTYDWKNNKALVSERAQREFGLPEVMEDFVDSWFDRVLVEEEDRQAYLHAVELVRQGEPQACVELRGKLKDNTNHWVRIQLTNIFNDNGESTKAIGSIQVIDDLKEMEAKYEIEKKKQQFGDMNLLAHISYNVSQDYMIESDLKIGKQAENQKITLGEICGEMEETIVDEYSRNRFQQLHQRDNLLKKYESGEQQFMMEMRCIQNDGRILWVRNEFHMMREPGESDVLLFEYSYDINKEKSLNLMMQFAVNDEYDLLGSVNYEDQNSVMLYGIKSYNPYKRKGALQEEHYTRSMMKFAMNAVVEEDREAYIQKAQLSRVKEELSKNNGYELYFRTKIDGVIANKRVRYINCEGITDMCLFIQMDITEMLKEEQRKRDEMEQALNAAKDANRAKTDFLSNMSHDMRTPMNGILGLTTILQDSTDPEEIRTGLEQIQLSGKYLLDLINDTLDMNKIESGKLELHAKPMNSEEVFHNVFANAKMLARERDIQLELHIPDIPTGNWVTVIADASRLEQIFMNVISNAMKYTLPGGTVTFTMNNLSVTDKMVVDQYIIRDTGIGMSEEYLPHMFEAFSQEGRENVERQNGTGLGMSIVKRLVEMMNGEISVKSKLNEGTEVTILIPYPISRQPVSVMEDDVDMSALAGSHVLLCEDHPLNRRIAVSLLEKKGVEVTTAENGVIGVTLFETSIPGTFDAVLMDVRMPVMDGIEATRQIRNSRSIEAKTIPIIAMTANAFDEDVRKCLEAGMNAHLAKPIAPEKLYHELARHLSS